MAKGSLNVNNGERKAFLQRTLSPTNVWAIAFGCIIGWGSFINPGKKFLPTSGVAGTAIAMVLGAAVMIIIALSYAYMVPKYPTAGGEFAFAKACFDKKAAFLCGWFLIAAYLTNVPMNSTAIGLIVDGLFGPVLKFGFHYSIAGFDVHLGEILFASGILIAFAALNMRGVKVAGVVQTILASCLIISVATLLLAALCSSAVKVENMAPLWGFDKTAALQDAQQGLYQSVEVYAHTATESKISAVLATFAIAPWAFVGFDTIPQAAEEFKFSYKKVSGIMVIAILFGCFVYITNNTVAAAALSNWPDLIVYSETTPWLLLTAAERLLGVYGKVLVGVAVSCAVLSGIMGFYMASSRLMYSMAREGYLPGVFAVVDPKYGTPRNAMLFCMLISLVGPVLGREALGWFVDMSAIGASIGFGFTCLATAKNLRKDHDGPGILYIASRVGSIFSALFIFLQLVPIPRLSGVHFGKESYIMLLVWSGIGILFYVSKRHSFKE